MDRKSFPSKSCPPSTPLKFFTKSSTVIFFSTKIQEKIRNIRVITTNQNFNKTSFYHNCELLVIHGIPLIFGVCKSVLSIMMANANVIKESGDLSFDTFIPQCVWPRFVLDFLELQL